MLASAWSHTVQLDEYISNGGRTREQTSLPVTSGINMAARAATKFHDNLDVEHHVTKLMRTSTTAGAC